MRRFSSRLKSIIEDQLQEMELLGYPAKDLANLSNDDIRRCNFKIVFATAEIVKEKPFRDQSSKLNRQNVSPRQSTTKVALVTTT